MASVLVVCYLHDSLKNLDNLVISLCVLDEFKQICWHPLMNELTGNSLYLIYGLDIPCAYV